MVMETKSRQHEEPPSTFICVWACLFVFICVFVYMMYVLYLEAVCEFSDGNTHTECHTHILRMY